MLCDFYVRIFVRKMLCHEFEDLVVIIFEQCNYCGTFTIIQTKTKKNECASQMCLP